MKIDFNESKHYKGRNKWAVGKGRNEMPKEVRKTVRSVSEGGRVWWERRDYVAAGQSDDGILKTQ